MKKTADNYSAATKTKKIDVTFWSGVRTVTGANFLISGGAKILIDCGLVQGVPNAEEENLKPFPYNPSFIDALLVTHAHIDHIGRIPKLVKDGFRGKIFSTPETKAISEFMLEDLFRVQDGALFEETHIRQALNLWETHRYHTPFSPISSADANSIAAQNISVEFLDAGHILGSAMMKIKWQDGKGGENKKGAAGGAGSGTERTIIFTGDTGNSPSPLVRDTEHLTGADYLVIDSVYGDRNHEAKKERRENFAAIVRDSIARGGTLVIPTFSLERAQILLYELDKLVEGGAIRPVPVFLDSPLAIRLTAIYKRSAVLFNDGARQEMESGDDIFNFPRLKISYTGRDSAAIAKTLGPKIIIAGSGMSSGGRVVGHEAAYLPEEKNTVLLTGYQAVGTLGRLLSEGAREVLINGEKVPVRARIETISGYSGHRDSDGLLELVSTAGDSLKKVFVVMGEPKSSLFLAQRIRDYLGIQAVVPEEGIAYRLDDFRNDSFE